MLILRLALLFAALALPLAGHAGNQGAGNAPALISFHDGAETLFEVRIQHIERYSATRARNGVPKLAIYLVEHDAERFARFIARNHGRRVTVLTCGELLGIRLLAQPDVEGRIKLVFMNTARSRAFHHALDSGEGC